MRNRQFFNRIEMIFVRPPKMQSPPCTTKSTSLPVEKAVVASAVNSLNRELFTSIPNSWGLLNTRQWHCQNDEGPLLRHTILFQSA